jgi:beta-lactam-binding protein with PASTA domain
VLLTGADAPQPTVCLVPRVVRRKLAVARELVTRAHCTVPRVQRKYSRRVRRNRVIAQAPVPGARAPEGTPVALVVSRGPRR